MKDYPPEKIRNVALVGHSGTGKTSLAEGLMFAAGATNRARRWQDYHFYEVMSRPCVTFLYIDA